MKDLPVGYRPSRGEGLAWSVGTAAIYPFVQSLAAHGESPVAIGMVASFLAFAIVVNGKLVIRWSRRLTAALARRPGSRA